MTLLLVLDRNLTTTGCCLAWTLFMNFGEHHGMDFIRGMLSHDRPTGAAAVDATVAR